MIVEIKNALVCDVITGDFKGHHYMSGVVYDTGKMYRIKIKDDSLYDKMVDNISHYVDIVCDFSTYQGKNIFSLVSLTPIE